MEKPRTSQIGKPTKFLVAFAVGVVFIMLGTIAVVNGIWADNFHKVFHKIRLAIQASSMIYASRFKEVKKPPPSLATEAKGESGNQTGPAMLPEPDLNWQNPGREETSRLPRVPLQMASLAKRQCLARMVVKYARHFGVDEDLVWAIIRQESGFNPAALSPKGAMGLMQLMPGTAALMGVSDAFDAEQNIAGGIKYLEWCLSRFNQNVGLALAAYNAGPENVVKYQGCPPFPETRNYVVSILRRYAGESNQDDLALFSLNPVIDEEVPDTVRSQGLVWRIPRPQWRIATPQCKLGSPRWKVTLRPF